MRKEEARWYMRVMHLSVNNDTNIPFCILEKSSNNIGFRLEENWTMHAY